VLARVPHAKVARKCVDGPIKCGNWTRRTDSDKPRKFPGREPIPLSDQQTRTRANYPRTRHPGFENHLTALPYPQESLPTLHRAEHLDSVSVTIVSLE
jgi:hypothetical protein